MNLPISCWAAEDIPSNKGENLGYASLSNSELLSILIGNGTKDVNAIEIGRIIMNRCQNNINCLSHKDRSVFGGIEGLGKQKIARIMAALELGRRRVSDILSERPQIKSGIDVYNHFYHLQDNEVEEFWICCIDQSQRLIKDVKISQGGITQTVADIRIIMRHLLINKATSLVAVHNHPSGSTRPSGLDKELTKQISKCCEMMNIYFQDHVIIGHDCYYSFHEQGLV